MMPETQADHDALANAIIDLKVAIRGLKHNQETAAAKLDRVVRELAGKRLLDEKTIEDIMSKGEVTDESATAG